MEQALPPGVQHGDHADLGAEMLRIGGDGTHGLRRRLEQDVVDDRLVLQGDGGDRRRHGEDDVEVRDGQQLGLSVDEPLRARQTLALRAVPVAAGIVGDADLAAIVARSTWPPSAAVRHASIGAHDPTLSGGQAGGVLGAIGGAVAAEDVRHLERGPHGAGSARRRHHQAEAIERAVVSAIRWSRPGYSGRWSTDGHGRAAPG